MDFNQLNETMMSGRTGLTETTVKIVSYDGVQGGDESYTGKAGSKEYSLWYPGNPNPKMSRYVKGDKVKVTDLDDDGATITARIVQRVR